MAAARKTAAGCLASGAPRRKWDELISAQGADLGAFRNQLAIDHVAPVVAELTSPRGGFISRCDARIIGEVVRDLGGGRLTQETVLNPAVGIDRLAKPGERIKAGDVLTIDKFAVSEIKTKTFVDLVRKQTDAEKVLIVSDSFDDKTYKSARNVKPVKLATAADVNTEQLLAFQKILVTSKALEKLAERIQ